MTKEVILLDVNILDRGEPEKELGNAIFFIILQLANGMRNRAWETDAARSAGESAAGRQQGSPNSRTRFLK